MIEEVNEKKTKPTRRACVVVPFSLCMSFSPLPDRLATLIVAISNCGCSSH